MLVADFKASKSKLFHLAKHAKSRQHSAAMEGQDSAAPSHDAFGSVLEAVRDKGVKAGKLGITGIGSGNKVSPDDFLPWRGMHKARPAMDATCSVSFAVARRTEKHIVCSICCCRQVVANSTWALGHVPIGRS